MTDLKKINPLDIALSLTKMCFYQKSPTRFEVLETFEFFFQYEQKFLKEFSKSVVRVPAVPIEESVTDDYIICLEDGKKLQILKRYLKTTYNLTPKEYKERWGLPNDYPVVAKNYSIKRSELAKRFLLGKQKKIV
jgi:predicted transcriptional regulator